MAYNILIVDDDREFREELRDYLHEYEVVEAASGEEALQILKRPNEIDLVILDVVMPGLKGTDVLKKIKALYPELGTVMLTGHSSVNAAVESLKGRADDYLEKPLQVAQIKTVIDGLLEKKAAGRGLDAATLEGKMEVAKQYIRRNCRKKLGLEDVAQKIYFSPKYFSRVFKEQVGMGFNDYKLRLKMEEAKGILNASGASVNQVSVELGYENTESFIRQFRKMTGRTPAEYRRKNRNSRTRKLK